MSSKKEVIGPSEFGPPLPTRLERAYFMCEKAKFTEDRAEENLYILEELILKKNPQQRE